MSDCYCDPSQMAFNSQADCEMNLQFQTEVIAGSGTGNIFSAEISVIKVLDKAEYDALKVKDPKTLYFIRG